MQNVATNGNRTFSIFGSIGEAARLTRGKTLLAILFPFVVVLLAMGGVFVVGDKADSYILSFLPTSSLYTALHYTVVTLLLIGLFYGVIGIGCGILKTAIERARGNSVILTSGFHSFSRAIPFVLTFICFIPVMLLQLVGLLFIDPKLHPIVWQLIQTLYGFIFTPFLLLSLLLVVDNYPPFKAIGKALRMGFKNWFKIVVLLILIDILSFIVAIPIFAAVYMHNQIATLACMAIIALVYLWLLPFMYLLQGVVYHKLMD